MAEKKGRPELLRFPVRHLGDGNEGPLIVPQDLRSGVLEVARRIGYSELVVLRFMLEESIRRATRRA
jgi:hypothetical protein